MKFTITMMGSSVRLVLARFRIIKYLATSAMG
jgi:hypothetical protein